MVFTVSTTADSNCYAVHISPTAASGVSQRQDIVKLARLLEKLPHDNHKTVQSVATQVQVSLERVDAEAASTSRKIAATLQCTGWLLQAAQGIPQPARGSALAAQVMAQHTAQLCFMAARNALEQSNPPGMDLEVLQVVMQPAPGSRIPGILTWLPWAAHSVQKWLEVTGAGTLHLGHPFLGMAEGVLVLWIFLLQAVELYSSSSSDGGGDVGSSSSASSAGATGGGGRGSSSSIQPIHPATWVAPPLLQLAHQVLRVPSSPQRVNLMRCLLLNLMETGAASCSLSAHPVLHQAVTGRPGDVALGAVAAEALRQDIWWHMLATSSKALADQGVVSGYKSDHPCQSMPLPCSSFGYPTQHTEPWGTPQLVTFSSTALDVLLLSELWDVWPWQLQQLQDANSHASTDSAEDNSSGSGSDKACSSKGPSSRSSSSSSSSSSNQGPSRNSSDGTISQEPSRSIRFATMQSWWSTRACITVPFTPHCVGTTTYKASRSSSSTRSSSSSSAVRAVTLQQLQLVTRSLYQGHITSTLTGILLMSLLLQRADAKVRAKFLDSPWGSYFLDVLVTLPQRSEPAGTSLVLPITCLADDPRTARADLMSILQGVNPGSGYRHLPAPAASLLALAWAHLQVEEGSELGWRPKLAAQSWAVLGMMSMNTGTPRTDRTKLPEYLVTATMPSAAFRFLPGLTPSLELFVTAERLLRHQRAYPPQFIPEAIQFVSVLLHAAVDAWYPEGAHTITGHDGSSSSSSSAPAAGLSPDILHALASLAVSVASCVHTAKPDEADFRSWSVLGPSTFIADDMLHVAAYELQLPEADRFGALRLAAAAQRLAATCLQVAEHGLHFVGSVLSSGINSSSSGGDARSGSRGNNSFNDFQTLPSIVLQQQQQHAGKEQVTRPGIAECMRVARLVDPCLLALHMVLRDFDQALGNRPRTPPIACPPWQVSSVDAGEHAAAAEELMKMCDNPLECVSELLEAAQQLQHACQPRVQLVGCSNLCCANLSGPSAEGLVAGRKGVRCGGCHVARYCCPACQQAHWPQHRHVCRRLAKAAVQGQVQG